MPIPKTLTALRKLLKESNGNEFYHLHQENRTDIIEMLIKKKKLINSKGKILKNYKEWQGAHLADKEGMIEDFINPTKKIKVVKPKKEEMSQKKIKIIKPKKEQPISVVPPPAPPKKIKIIKPKKEQPNSVVPPPAPPKKKVVKKEAIAPKKPVSKKETKGYEYKSIYKKDGLTMLAKHKKAYDTLYDQHLKLAKKNWETLEYRGRGGHMIKRGQDRIYDPEKLGYGLNQYNIEHKLDPGGKYADYVGRFHNQMEIYRNKLNQELGLDDAGVIKQLQPYVSKYWKARIEMEKIDNNDMKAYDKADMKADKEFRTALNKKTAIDSQFRVAMYKLVKPEYKNKQIDITSFIHEVSKNNPEYKKFKKKFN